MFDIHEHDFEFLDSSSSGHDHDDDDVVGSRALSVFEAPGSEFVFLGFKWGPLFYGAAGGTVTWSFHTAWAGTTAMTEPAYQALVQSAFNRWEAQADVNFFQLPDGSNADITIAWDKIDGKSGILGETSFSYQDVGKDLDRPVSTSIGMDLGDYNRAANAAQARNSGFEVVFAHEVGHALGLDHSQTNAALMGTYYDISNGVIPVWHVSDLEAAHLLYGAAPGAEHRARVGTDGNDQLDYSGNGLSILIFAGAGNDLISGGAADDRLFSGNGHDLVYSGHGDDFVYNPFGKVTAFGDHGDDLLQNVGDGAGNLNGEQGSDVLVGGIGDDFLRGGTGNDTLIGDGFAGGFLFGNDVLDGGTGNDTLTGGLGADRFVFAGNGGKDRIQASSLYGSAPTFAGSQRDFETGVDTLDFRMMGYGTEARGLAALTIKGRGGDTVLSIDGTTITLVDLSVAEFQTSDILWV